MDIASISKVANRKKINNEAEKLRDKLSRQTSDIIKLKVAQDTAYWDLKEKYQQLEGNHEKLQQNMVEVQMQHEAISGQYQEELRLRPDILNKIQTTRDLATVLEQYSDRLKNTLSKCISDKNALSQAFKKSGALVKDMKDVQNNMDELYKRNLDTLTDKLKKEEAHNADMLHLYRSAQKRDEEEITKLKVELTATKEGKEKIDIELREMKRSADKLRVEVENKARIITELQADMRRLILEVDGQEKKVMATVAILENENKIYLEKMQALETALKNQERYTETVKTENKNLQDKIISAEEENKNLNAKIQQYEVVIQESEIKIEKLTSDVTRADEFRAHLEDVIQEQENSLDKTSTELITLKSQIANLEREKLQTTSKLEESTSMCAQLSQRNQQLQEKIKELDENLAQCLNNIENMEKSYTQKMKELNSTIEAKEREVTTKSEAVNSLMNDLSMNKERLSSLENELEKARVDIMGKEDKITIGEKANVVLTDKIKEKDRECSKQMTMILELRSEKEHLQSEIQELNNTINNIQKEVTGTARRHRSPVLQAEMDDNAVSMTPRDVNQKSQPQKLGHSQMFAVPQSIEEPKKRQNMIYDFNSDNSMEEEFDFSCLMAGSQNIQKPNLKRRPTTPSRSQGGLRSVVEEIENESTHRKKKTNMFFKTKKERKIKP